MLFKKNFYVTLFISTTISVGWCAEKKDKNEHLLDNKIRNHLGSSLILLDITNKKSPENTILRNQLRVERPSSPKHEIENIYEAYEEKYVRDWMLTTRDTMRKLANSASKGDPVSILYLAHAFNKMSTVEEDICPLAIQLYQKAFQDLNKIALEPNHPHFNKANYLLAKEYDNPVFTDRYNSGAIFDSAEKVLKSLGTVIKGKNMI